MTDADIRAILEKTTNPQKLGYDYLSVLLEKAKDEELRKRIIVWLSGARHEEEYSCGIL